MDRQYRRVSPEEQKKGTSLQTQLEACRNKAHELGYEVLGIETMKRKI